ncbi:hypothetical protein CRUP_004687 [Coryphaenoides rupestris]|nr:hypothetical protein CRUP_004687 [Coryphaenoides rupestris]
MWDLWVLDWVQQRAECVRFCVGQSMSPAGLLPVSMDIEYEFSTRNAYNFLQVIYYKLDKFQKAASAAHTFFVANPSHLEMRNNLEKYRRMKGVTDDDFQDRELHKEMHWVLYDSALLSEASSDWPQAARNWQKSVNETLWQTEECRVQSLSLSLLSCQQSCVTQVATRPGRISALEDFLPTQLEHQHIAQFKAGDLGGAIQTLRSLLLFYPSDADSLSNLQLYYETLGGDTVPQDTDNQPSPELASYVDRSLQEKKLLYFGKENLAFDFIDPDLWTPEDVVPESLRESWRAEKEKLSKKEEEKEEEMDDSGFYGGGPAPRVGVTITMDDEALNGTNRVVLDGVMTNRECDTILQLAAAAASAGDGYRGRRSPHTPHEKFEGLTVLKAAKLAQDGMVNQSDARLLHELGERARILLHSYFRSPAGLFFSFTHLVCRTAITGDQEGRLDLSHPVHARVRPACGRLVGFSSGPVNPHGVMAEREEVESLWAVDGQSVAKTEDRKGNTPSGRSGRSLPSKERSRGRGEVTGGKDEL